MNSTNESASFFLSPPRSVLTSIVLNCYAFGWYTIWNLFFFYSKNKPCNNNNKNWMQMKCRRRRKKSQRDMRQKSSTVSTQHKHSSDTILSLLIHIFNANNCGVKRKSGTNNRMQWKSACCFASCSRANRAKKKSQHLHLFGVEYLCSYHILFRRTIFLFSCSSRLWWWLLNDISSQMWMRQRNSHIFHHSLKRNVKWKGRKKWWKMLASD